MFSLSDSALTVEVLDPRAAADRIHLGPRFCWGGYIWQVQDAAAGPLFAGPQWPEPNPETPNGQGAPECFRHDEDDTGRSLLLADGRGFVIGVGDVEPGPKGKPVVTAPCMWTITETPGAIEFCTEQSGNGFACQLTRRVTLRGRTLTSATWITNTGPRPLPSHWFAHPFFALTDRLLTCDLPPTWGMAENAGYILDASHRLSFRKRFEHRQTKGDGHLVPLLVDPRTPLRAVVSHPTLREVIFTTEFVPTSCPIWGNDCAWSMEAYLRTLIEPGSHRVWKVNYEFGPVRRD